MKNGWRGKNLLVTAGPTREYWDPVRFLSNASSGTMGYALARAAARKGARVTLVSGPTGLKPPAGLTFVPVVSARDMLKACLRVFPRADGVVAAAAVSDWRPARPLSRKIKKGSSAPRSLPLVKNPDILGELSRRRKRGRPLLMGFALETHGLLKNARLKMALKNLDFIVANGPDSLEGDRTRAWVLNRRGPVAAFRGRKAALSRMLLGLLEEKLP